MGKAEASKKIDDLIVRLSNVDRGSVPRDVKQESEIITGLLLDERLLRRSKLIDVLEIAVSSLLQEPPNSTLATNLRESVQSKLEGRSVAFGVRFRRLSDMAPPVIRVLGLASFLYVAVPILWANWELITATKIENVEVRVLVLVGLFGALGSIVSMLVRLGDFSEDEAEKHDIDPMVILLAAFFRPIVGISFALFIYFACKSNMIPIKIPNDTFDTHFYLALAFIAGFSERFAKDVISGAEKRLSGTFAKKSARKGQSGP